MTDAQAQIVDPMIGTRIDGRYLVQDVLGRGGMAIVYGGVHEQLGRAVAIKVLSLGIALDPILVERFLREARMASGLSHNNIVEVWDLGRLPDGRPYLVMPKLSGVDFSTFLEREGPQSPARVAELLSGVALALDFVHAKGLLHRDVKLENLMYIEREDGSEHVMLMDFGIATAVASPTSARLTDYGVVCGTPAYLPPEVAVGVVSDRRADVYALATVAFELMTGRLPFQSDDPLRILPLKATHDAPRMSEVTGHEFPEAIELAIAQGLAFRPDDRFSRAGEFVAALEDAVMRSADELGIAGRPGDRQSKQFFGRGLHSALYKIPERESPRSLAPAERVAEVDSRRRASPPRGRGLAAHAPVRRGTFGVLGWLGCLALAALLAPVIWSARSNSRTSVPRKTLAAAKETAWEARPSGNPASNAGSQLESPGDLQVQDLFTPLAESPSDPALGPSMLPIPHQETPPPAAQVFDNGGGARHAMAAVAATRPVPAPRPPVKHGAEAPADSARAAASVHAAPLNPAPPPAPAPTPKAPAEPSTGDVAAGAAVLSATTPAADVPPAPARSAEKRAPMAAAKGPTPPAGNSSRARSPVVEPLPLPSDPQPRAQLSRVPAPAPLPLELQDRSDRETATDALPAADRPSSVAKLNEEANTALLGGHLARAAGLYQQATRDDPQSVSAWRGLALTSERLGRTQEAIFAYSRAVALAPSGPQAETLRGRLKNLQSHP